MNIEFLPIADCPAEQPFVECRGVDLSVDLSDQQRGAIRQGLLDHGLLLFRHQQAMTPEREVVFNQSFGWHDPDQRDFLFGFGAPTTEHRVSGAAQMPEWPQVSVLGNVLLDDYHGIRASAPRR